MVMKNSEYRTSFKPAFETHAKAYEENLDFRTARKSREFQHNRDAFCWAPQEWEKGSASGGSSISVLEEPRPGSVPSHRYKHKLYNQMFQEKQLRESLQEHCVVHGAVKAGTTKQTPADEGPPSPPPSPESTTPPEQYNGVVMMAPSGPTKVQKVPSGSSSKKPVKPQQKVVSKKCSVRPKSSTGLPKKSTATPISPREGKPPFVMYGSRDNEVKIGQQKTHNIRATVDVYPSAVRAQRYREILKEKRLKSAPRIGKRKPLTFDQIMDKQTASWQTEYSGHFVGYESKEYERSVCSRMGGGGGRKSMDL